MSKVAVEHLFNGVTTGITNYNPNVTNLGSGLKQYSGINSSDNYVSTYPSAIFNIPEAAISSMFMPHVYKWSEDIYWVFMGANASAAVTRNLSLFEFNKSNNSITYKGYVTIPGTTIIGNKTIRSLRGFVYNHTAGTVSTTGDTSVISGSSTLFQTERIASGARIGFGSTDPTQITQWYEIDSISSDTSLTINGSVTLSGGTSYVIEEIRLLVGISNVTLTRGGLYLLKGLNYSTFQSGGTTITEASQDNVRGSYRLIDAATSTLNSIMGSASRDETSKTEQIVYVLNADTTTTVRIHKFNIRAELSTISSASSTDAWLYKTQAVSITGTIPVVNNGRFFTVNHGSAAGIDSVWFATTTRIYRCTESDILSNSSSFISDFMTEVPPGGSSSYIVTNAMNQVDYTETLDRIFIPTSAQRFGIYIGEYDTSPLVSFEKIFGSNQNRVKTSLTPSGTVDGLFPTAISTVWSVDGYIFVAPNISTSGLNWLYIFPFLADSYYSSNTNQRIITPKLSTIGASQYYRVYVEHSEYLGDPTLGFPGESYRIYWRTTGIDDNSGAWTEVNENGDMTSVLANDYIQFMIELEVLGEVCVPQKIYSVCCLYDNFTTDSHYQPSIKFSDYINKRFAWWFGTAWGTTVPNLRVRLYDADNDNLIVDDNTENPSGTFEKSTDGGVTWTAYNNSDRSNSNTYIRYTPASIADNIKVKFLLTEL